MNTRREFLSMLAGIGAVIALPRHPLIDSLKRVPKTVRVDLTDRLIICDTTAGNITVQLPPASLVPARTFQVFKDSRDSNTVTVVPASGETINGRSSIVLYGYGDSVEVFNETGESEPEIQARRIETPRHTPAPEYFSEVRQPQLRLSGTRRISR